MRELPTTLALSLLVHAAAVTAYVATVDSEPSRLVTKPPPPIELAPMAVISEPAPAEPPVEIALLDDDTVARFPDSAPTIAAIRPTAKDSVREMSRTKAIATKPTTELVTEPITEPPTSEPPKDPKKKPSLLSMRGERDEPTFHRRGSDGISDEALEAMVDGKLPVKIANVPGAKGAELDRAQARLENRGWVEKATGEELTAARFDRAAARQAKKDVELKEQADGTHTSEKTTFTARVNRDGTVDLKDKGNWQQKSLFHAEFDVTDAFMRNQGHDPYASEKRKFLDRTREQRVEIGKRYRKEQLAQSAQLMADNLARLWAITSDPAKRKDELLALWDECAEVGDEDLVAGGAHARRLLINWIHAKRVEFTPAELVAFAKRKKSKATFAP
ncbi:MAG: hypothetical protein ACKV2T_13620 [Kofleriaceae bacterium]